MASCFAEICSVIVVEKLASLFNAAANSLRVSNVEGEEPTKSLIAVLTKAVVAICVVFVVEDAVGAVGVPVKAGFNNGAFKFSSVNKSGYIRYCYW